jgi:hypothetical protein
VARFDVLEAWTLKVEEARERLLGKTPCHCKLFIDIDGRAR